VKFRLPKPINETQREFAVLCELGGGIRGGRARSKVIELLQASGKSPGLRFIETPVCR
jgi:hypothetical protein